ADDTGHAAPADDRHASGHGPDAGGRHPDGDARRQEAGDRDEEERHHGAGSEEAVDGTAGAGVFALAALGGLAAVPCNGVNAAQIEARLHATTASAQRVAKTPITLSL